MEEEADSLELEEDKPAAVVDSLELEEDSPVAEEDNTPVVEDKLAAADKLAAVADRPVGEVRRQQAYRIWDNK